MKKLYRILTVIVILLISNCAFAQYDGFTMTFLKQVPLSNYHNLGIRMPYNGYFGIGLSNINISLYNSSIKYDNLFSSDGTVITADKFIESLDDNNYIGNNISLDLLNVGFRVKKFFFSIDWQMKNFGQFDYSKDLFGFLVRGNGNYTDKPADVSFGINQTCYSEISVSAQYDINDKLTVGIRPKYLNGIYNVKTESFNALIATDPETYAMTADLDVDVKFSSMLKNPVYCLDEISKAFDIDSLGFSNVFNFTKNTGWSIDLGASYKFNDIFGVSAAIFDLGFIKWKETKQFYKKKTDISINDAIITDIDDIINGDFDFTDVVDNLIDNTVGNDSIKDGKDYKTNLQTRFMVQGYAEFNPMLRLNAVGQLIRINDKFKPAFTIAYSGVFFNTLNLSVSYTMAENSFNNIGLGLGVHLGSVNLYLVSDNILSMKTLFDTHKLFNVYNLRFGLVISIGKYKN